MDIEWKYLADREEYFEHSVYFVERGIDLWKCARLKVCFFYELGQGENRMAIITARRSGFSFQWDYIINNEGQLIEFPYGQIQASLPDWERDPNWALWVGSVQATFKSVVKEAWECIQDGDG